ncbi:oxysterol-binding protein-related protein 9-like [Dendronephthya gigantea]|uniref:oxysterol-binding protein-related protein 9-like n=1 Tax=Dendronephthya gigantea TaxID=151771 RepID=UPI001068DB29|nr:oxysterol-binding protein-related protein 9-like [Dendronephthya gigantea]
MAISMEGPLSKWTNVVKGWQYRWFVLDETVGLLSYYTSKEKMMRGARRGCLRLKGALLGIDDEDDSTFTISCDQKTFHFQARDAEEREKWIGALETTVMKHSHSGLRRPFGTDLGLITSEDDLDKKLTEAEAYFKLFTEQVKALHAQMSNDCTNEHDPPEVTTVLVVYYLLARAGILPCPREGESPTREMLGYMTTWNIICNIMNHFSSYMRQIIRETSTKMLENIGQSLEMMHSVKESYEGGESTPVLNGEQPNVVVEEKSARAPSLTDSEIVSPGIGDTFPIPVKASPVRNSKGRSGTSPSQAAHRMADAFPTISYSSSEDEDPEFFDANEYDNDIASASESQKGVKYHEDEDDIFGAEIEGDDIKKHGSIITHLLSQVRLGMDLTKVVLPTFILERRSLLEMYADFLAHPDLFASIGDFDDPKDRMIQAVKWYLSAFHAGRKSSIAKKPYNPILGESFRCHYVLDENNRSKELTKDGPVAGISKDDVGFVAEQLSHHPPVSAFYAEHPNKKISCTGHIWTKSKFLGLSIGVEMVGQGCISVIPYDEEYIATFPNAYGRSILTVPWMEMGGQTAITCAKSGYNANIHFHCKPFYGGKKHRVTAEITAPGEKKPFFTVNGEWNGVMYYKEATEGQNISSSETPQVFIDTKTMPVFKKRVAPLDKQEEFESRRLWRDVTEALKTNDIESATAGKHKLEERQRAEARERKESGEKWQTKLFHENNGVWTYDAALTTRLKGQTAGK